MRFDYEYRTSDNALHRGVVSASSSSQAYAVLKRDGIRPSRLVESPGFFNKLFGKGKRWIAIVILGMVAAYSLGELFKMNREGGSDAIRPLPRHQIQGIPLDWGEYIDAIFQNPADRVLARYSQPGVLLPADMKAKTGPAPQAEWVDVLKRIVAGIREESANFGRMGKTEQDFETYLDERQRMEAEYRNHTVRQVQAGSLDAKQADVMLSAMGLKSLEKKD